MIDEEKLIDKAVSLARAGRYSNAEDILQELVNGNSCNPRVYRNIGTICQHQDRLEEALWYFVLNLEIDPGDTEAYFNMGVVLGELGDIDKSIASYKQCINASGGRHYKSEFNLSLLLFHKNQYELAWPLYENSRFNLPNARQPYFCPNIPLWAGSTDVTSGHVLLVGEQGLGDCIQFMRYCKSVAEMADRVSLCVPDSLVQLARNSNVADFICGPEEANDLNWNGSWLPLLSVPRLLGVSPTTPLLTRRYVFTTPEAERHWSRCFSGRELMVGINWQGNPDTERNSLLRNRSFKLEEFSPLSTIPNVRLISLQKGFGSEQLTSCSFQDRFIDSQDEIDSAWDFIDTAAIISNCDLVITSDTVIAHLAGAMHKMTWLILPKIADWRWGLESDGISWYPTMRIFRQNRRGDWKGVMGRVKEELTNLANTTSHGAEYVE